MASKDNTRMKAYKNRALDTSEMRRRREEEGVQLRKSKREEQVCEHELQARNDISRMNLSRLITRT